MSLDALWDVIELRSLGIGVAEPLPCFQPSRPLLLTSNRLRVSLSKEGVAHPVQAGDGCR